MKNKIAKLIRKKTGLILSSGGITHKRIRGKWEVPIRKSTVEQLLYLQRMLDMAPRGCVVECGMGKLKSFQMFAFLINGKRHLYGFDSFEGFPEPTQEDKSPRNPKKGQWKVMTADDAVDYMHSLKTGTKMTIIKGFFNERLPFWKESLPPIAVLHIDADLYQSNKDVLENLYPLVIKGGIVMFDEYANENELYKFPGAKKAVDEYLGADNIRQDERSGKFYHVKMV